MYACSQNCAHVRLLQLPGLGCGTKTSPGAPPSGADPLASGLSPGHCSATMGAADARGLRKSALHQVCAHPSAQVTPSILVPFPPCLISKPLSSLPGVCPIPGALLPAPIPLCWPWLLLPAPDDTSLSRAEGEAAELGHALVHSSPITAPSHVLVGRCRKPVHRSSVNRNEPKLVTSIISQLFMAVSYYQAEYSCSSSQYPTCAAALPGINVHFRIFLHVVLCPGRPGIFYKFRTPQGDPQCHRLTATPSLHAVEVEHCTAHLVPAC